MQYVSFLFVGLCCLVYCIITWLHNYVLSCAITIQSNSRTVKLYTVIHLLDEPLIIGSVCSVRLLQDNSRAPGSPTSLRVPPNGGCEDLDMETEEEDELRARGQITTK